MDKKKAKSKEIEKLIEETKEAEAPLPDISEITKKKEEPLSSEPKDVLLMRVVTWLRDSHALFDYESRQIQKKNMKVDHSCKFVRQKDEVKTVALNFNVDEEQETTPLFSLVKDDKGDYFISTEKHSTEKLWLVVRAMKIDSKNSAELK